MNQNIMHGNTFIRLRFVHIMQWMCFTRPALRKMTERAFIWAETNKKSRVNAVHGEQEAFLVLTESFAVSSTDIDETIQEGSVEVEEQGV